MTKELVQDILVLTLNILIMIIVLNSYLFETAIQINNYSINLGILIATILLIFLQIIKNSNNFLLAQNVTRINKERIFYFLVNKFYIISFILLFLYLNQISLWVAILIIFFEIAISYMYVLLSTKNIKINSSKRIFLIKEYLYFLVILLLLNNNLPFELYSLEIQSIFISIYLIYLIYINYKIVLILNEEL